MVRTLFPLMSDGRNGVMFTVSAASACELVRIAVAAEFHCGDAGAFRDASSEPFK